MNTKQRTIIILILIMSFAMLGCGLLGQVVVPTLTPAPTNMPLPTETSMPILGKIHGRIFIVFTDGTNDPIVTGIFYGELAASDAGSTSEKLFDDTDTFSDAGNINIVKGSRVSLTTDTNGNYSIEGLKPNSTYKLFVVLDASNSAFSACAMTTLPEDKTWVPVIKADSTNRMRPVGEVLYDFTVSPGEDLERNLSIPCNGGPGGFGLVYLNPQPVDTTVPIPTTATNPSTSVSAGSKKPVSGDWVATTNFGKLVFTVDATGAKITKMSYQFSNWTCGPTTNSGTIEITSEWPITNSNFSIDESLSPDNNQTMKFSGTYDAANQKFSGTWAEISYGANCSGTWEATAP